MQKIIASNFKTNHTRQSTQKFLKNLSEFLDSKADSALNMPQITIFPPLSALENDNFKHFSIGAQNAYPIFNGSVTGEVGLEQLEEFGIKTLLIGHSERREILGENQAFCAKKFNFFKEHNFNLYYCIGEPLEVKNKGLESTLDYLEAQLVGIDLNYKNLVIAYEPIWAIGSGISASIEEITQIHYRLKQKLGKIPLLYGGSVKAQNVREILSISSVDGVLIGSASWSLEGFCQIIENSFKE